MSSETPIVKSQSLAALKNVFGCMQLVLKLQQRAPGLPNIGAIYGPSGYGKTYGTIYAQNKTRAVRVEVGESWSRRSFLSAILREAGVAQTRASIADLMEAVIHALGEDPDRPLIIDESDKLVDKGMIELVREIAEQAQIPVVLVGEELLPQKLARVERVHNRILDWYPAEPCDLDDCRKLANIFLAGVDIDDALLDQVRARGQGRARRIVVTLTSMQEWARNTGVKALTIPVYKGVIFTGEAPAARSGRIAPARGRGA